MNIRGAFFFVSLLLALSIAVPVHAEETGGKDTKAPAQQAQPPASPYFLRPIPEGDKAKPANLQQERENIAATARVHSVLGAMQHVGLYATYLIAMLAVAGVVGAVIAFVVSLITRRRAEFSARR